MRKKRERGKERGREVRADGEGGEGGFF